MKKIFYLSMGMISLLQAACNTAPNNKTETATIATASVGATTIATQPADLNGVWLNAAYIDDLKVTRSPMSSSSKLGEIAVFQFDSATMKGDTLNGGLSFNGHEGGECQVVFRTSKGQSGSATLLPISGVKPEAERSIFVENGQLMIGSEKALRYNRIESAQNVDDVVAKAVIQTLFAGNWNMTDDGGGVSKIKVGADGKVSGNPGISTMDVLTDFVADAPPTDQAYFFDGENKRPYILAFKHSGGNVEFFHKNSLAGKPRWVWTR